MPRQPRDAPPGQIVHVTSRFVDGRYVLDDDGRDEYLRRFDRAIAPTDWELISYGLPNTHVHLGLVAGQHPLGSWLGPMHNGFAQWVHRRRRTLGLDTLGHVFGDRPGCKPVEPDGAATLIAYHHNQAVHAGLVVRARDSNWSSQRAYLGLERAIGALDVKLGLKLSGRTALELEEFTATRVKPPPTDLADWIVWRAAREHGVTIEELRQSRQRRAVFAKRVAISMARGSAVPVRAIAEAVGMTPTGVHRYLRAPDAEASSAAEWLLARTDAA